MEPEVLSSRYLTCVEFFFQPRLDDPHYYNFEWNAIGTLNLSWRTGRADPEPAPEQVLAMVRAESSIGTGCACRYPEPFRKPEPFAERPADGPWSLLVKIPAKALWRSNLKSFDQLESRANFFKCGDALAVPHYVTWAPINTPSPDYHRPEFFAPVEFE